MNPISVNTLKRSNEAAIFNVYLYLSHMSDPQPNETLKSITKELESASKEGDWSNLDIYRLKILKNAVYSNRTLADSKLIELTRSKDGLTACAFQPPSGEIFVIFCGTGKGEWIDNGEGLSGIPQKNVYITYGENGNIISRTTVHNDYATDQQVESLNWFNMIAARNGWNKNTDITVTGHSKGGNKAQFITLHSELVKTCLSFDGQGFSPEAEAAFEKRYQNEFNERIQKIYSLSADNDYVNVLGESIAPEEQKYYFESFVGFHFLEAILDEKGQLRPMCEQGELSLYVKNISNELMGMRPYVRKYATLGIMNILQKYLGKGTPVNGDNVSVSETLIGLVIAAKALLTQYI